MLAEPHAKQRPDLLGDSRKVCHLTSCAYKQITDHRGVVGRCLSDHPTTHHTVSCYSSSSRRCHALTLLLTRLVCMSDTATTCARHADCNRGGPTLSSLHLTLSTFLPGPG